MSFPSSPVDGQIYNDYKYNLSTLAWDKLGDILEIGNNSNGHWIKYSNGIMVQYNYSSNSFTTTTSQDHDIDYPIPFVTINFFTASARPLTSWAGLDLISFIHSSGSPLIRGKLHINSTSAQSMTDLSWNATGTWK